MHGVLMITVLLLYMQYHVSWQGLRSKLVFGSPPADVTRRTLSMANQFMRHLLTRHRKLILKYYLILILPTPNPKLRACLRLLVLTHYMLTTHHWKPRKMAALLPISNFKTLKHSNHGMYYNTCNTDLMKSITMTTMS